MRTKNKFVFYAVVILMILSAMYITTFRKLRPSESTLSEPISPKKMATVSPTPTRSPEQIENDRLECLRKGGDWQSRPFGRGNFCNIPQIDSGKSCTDGAQCLSGNCIADESSNGECSKYSMLYGCYTFLGKSPYQTNPRSSKIETNQVCID